jgi:hypothetical protein
LVQNLNNLAAANKAALEQLTKVNVAAIKLNKALDEAVDSQVKDQAEAKAFPVPKLGRRLRDCNCATTPVARASDKETIRCQPIARPKVWPGTPIASSLLRASRPSFATE